MKTAIVTGGGTGIGLATCHRLAAAGYRIVAGGLDSEGDLPDGAKFVKTDVTNADDLKALVASADRVDALVNCAGILRQEKEWGLEDFKLVLDVNLTASLAVANVAREKLRASSGSIVNIASMWSYFGSPKSPAYASSKSGIVGLTRSMAVAWGPEGIRVNAVAPGWVMTRMAIGAKNDPERGPRITSRIPLGRWAEPSDVANVIAFLVSEDAAYVHGVVLPVDGGYSIA
ncbi:MAG: SDR family oxidoreductase [Rhizobiaceae bacterium]|nr:SDR family oxidoreductase [Rhizobiaceae bacterium]